MGMCMKLFLFLLLFASSAVQAETIRPTDGYGNIIPGIQYKVLKDKIIVTDGYGNRVPGIQYKILKDKIVMTDGYGNRMPERQYKDLKDKNRLPAGAASSFLREHK